jgi:hypothetical protein
MGKSGQFQIVLPARWTQLRATLVKSSTLFLFVICHSLVAGAMEWKTPQFEVGQQTNAFTQPLNGYRSFESMTDLSANFGLSSDLFSFKLSPWTRTYVPLSVGGDAHEQRTYFEVKEGWLELAGDNADVRAGNQIISWGSADAVNPTDVWNASDLIDPLSATKLPITAIKLSLHPVAAEHWQLDLIAVPGFRPHRLPISIFEGTGQTQSVQLTDSRWLIPSPQSVNIGGGSVLPVEYEIRGADFPKDIQAGARLRIMRVSEWDFSFTYSQTTQQMPAFAAQTRGSPTNPALPLVVTLIPEFYRVGTVGFDAAGTVHSVGVRFEIAQRDALGSLSPEVSKASLWGTLGLDYSFFIGKTELYLNTLFVYKDTAPSRVDPLVLGVPSFEPWDRNLVFSVELRFSTRLKLGLRQVSSLVNQDGWLHPFVSYQAIDALKLELGGDVFFGSLTGVFGQYADNDRVTSTLVLDF